MSGQAALDYHVKSKHKKAAKIKAPELFDRKYKDDETGLYKCPQCPEREYTCSYSLKRHLRQHVRGPKMYACEICGKCLASTESLRCHIRSHTGEKPFKCEECGRSFASTKILKEHSYVHTGERRYECRICHKRFTQRGPLNIHFKKTHPGEVRYHASEKHFSCHLCNKNVLTNSELNRHLLIHRKKLLFPCDFCNTKFKSNYNLIYHIKRYHTNTNPLGKNNENGENYEDKNDLAKIDNALPPPKHKNAAHAVKNIVNKKIHPKNCNIRKDGLSKIDETSFKTVKNQSGVPDTFKCGICLKAVKSKSYLEQHKKRHLKQSDFGKNGLLKIDKTSSKSGKTLTFDDFKCDICLKIVGSKNYLVQHKKRHLKDYVAKCEVCNAGFCTKREYELHVGCKHGASSFICNACGKSFYGKESLKSHMLRHNENYGTNNDHIKCDICNKTFLQMKYLRKHKWQIHKDGGRHFICDLCGKKVTSKITLRDHILVHQGLKPLECTLCGKHFAIANTLKLHMRTHTGQKPYECKLCGKAFTQSSTLTVHMRKHTGERPYTCNLCEFRCSKSGNLVQHKKRVHKYTL